MPDMSAPRLIEDEAPYRRSGKFSQARSWTVFAWPIMNHRPAPGPDSPGVPLGRAIQNPVKTAAQTIDQESVNIPKRSAAPESRHVGSSASAASSAAATPTSTPFSTRIPDDYCHSDSRRRTHRSEREAIERNCARRARSRSASQSQLTKRSSSGALAKLMFIVRRMPV